MSPPDPDPTASLDSPSTDGSVDHGSDAAGREATADPDDEAPTDPDDEAPTDPDDEAGPDPDGETGSVTVEDGPAGREVVVPLALYKRVTVFSTLVAMLSVVAGFALLDRATNRATLPVSEVDPWLALAGLGLILLGSATYAFSTRFRATGMGSSKTDEDGGPDNG